MNRKKLILVILLVILFIAILYQVAHLKSYRIEENVARRKQAPRISGRPYLNPEDIQPPNINLNLLKEIDTTSQPSGRNLFKFGQVRDRQVRVAEESVSKVEHPSPALAEEVEPVENASPLEKSPLEKGTSLGFRIAQ